MVGEHDGESPEASHTTTELQKQIDSLQGQITDIHRTQGTTGENSNLSSEVQSLKEKLDEHSKQLEQSAEKLGQPQTENAALWSGTRIKLSTQQATRSVASTPGFDLWEI